VSEPHFSRPGKIIIFMGLWEFVNMECCEGDDEPMSIV